MMMTSTTLTTAPVTKSSVQVPKKVRRECQSLRVFFFVRARVFREEESLFGRLERAHIEAIDRIVSLYNRYRGVSLSLLR